MTKEEISHLLDLWRASTPGPWTARKEDGLYACFSSAEMGVGTCFGMGGRDLLDAAFIVAAHEMTPRLCEEVERLTARVAELETAPNTDPDCYDHADNVCVDWCGGCQRGVYGRAKRASAMTPGETP